MRRSKQRNAPHVIDQDAQFLLRSVLPKEWVLREYRPDYGIDFDVEVFAPTGEFDVFETLGEHFFVQLKGIRKADRAERQRVKLYHRGNVAKGPLVEDRSQCVGEMEVIAFDVETEELVTVERMGTALPVLLVLADLEANKCFFVCLNDYIDKLLIPKHPDDYASADSRVVHVPVLNDMSTEVGLTAMRWYAKRAKLYAAFQKFVYQCAELSHATSTREFAPLAKHFAKLLLEGDYWDTTEQWGLISYYGGAVRRFADSGDPGLMRIDGDALEKAVQGDDDLEQQLRADLKQQEPIELWRLLAVLPRNYEEICREWFLPTWLGFSASYP